MQAPAKRSTNPPSANPAKVQAPLNLLSSSNSDEGGCWENLQVDECGITQEYSCYLKHLLLFTQRVRCYLKIWTLLLPWVARHRKPRQRRRKQQRKANLNRVSSTHDGGFCLLSTLCLDSFKRKREVCYQRRPFCICRCGDVRLWKHRWLISEGNSHRLSSLRAQQLAGKNTQLSIFIFP